MGSYTSSRKFTSSDKNSVGLTSTVVLVKLWIDGWMDVWMRSCPLLCCPSFPPFCFPSSVSRISNFQMHCSREQFTALDAIVAIAEMEVLVAKMIQTGSDGATPGFSITLSNRSGETGSEF
jgi:hypothetical protein